MKSKIYIHSLVISVAMLGLFGRGTAQTTENLKPAVERAAISAEKKHRMQSAVVDLNFQWGKDVYLSDMVSRRRPGFKDVMVRKEQKNTFCRGVLTAGNRRVLTPSRCAQAPEGFSLKEVRLSFANGRKGIGTPESVNVNGEVAEVLVSSQLTAGLHGVYLGAVPPGKTLADTFGREILDELLQFFISRGVVSARANRIVGMKNTLQVGDPFFYQGKLVALVREVPSRLPVSFWGGVSEKPLVLLRTQHQNGLFASR